MLKKIQILAFANYFLAVIPLLIFGQQNSAGIKIYAENRQQYDFPWAGGMNSCQFGKIDLDLDGKKDLVVFDRTGDRIMPFLAVQSGGYNDYKYAPEFIEKFPLLSHWVIFEDYDRDGFEDIFTYSPGYASMKVYRNTSESTLEFTVAVSPYLTSFQGVGYVNILVTYADYPAICDLDNDGDLDILTFYGLGSFVEKHRNMSMEKYGHADSLDFMKTESCWGYFAESEESNQLTLDTCLRCETAGSRQLLFSQPAVILSEAKELRHTGSTFRVLDLNGDALPDLLLGDVDYPNLVALFNGGSIDTAKMTSYEWNFPAYNKPVDLFSMPASFYDDFDFDGIKDLLVSPFDPNPFLTNNFQSAWLYHNTGTDNQPQFNLQSRSFLQNRMIDLGAGAYPVLYDIDRDGLTDLLIGNYGYYDTSYYDEFMILHTKHTGQIAFLKNTGTLAQPAFTFIDRDFAGVSSLALNGITPTFSDLDGDGDSDMLVGSGSGQIILYLNTTVQGEPVKMELSQMNFQGIDVGAFSAPQLFDLNKDNLADLVIGEKGGNLNFYRNTGTLQKPAFTFTTDSLGKVNVTDPSVSLDGYSVPFFFRDEQDQTHLLVGSEKGVVMYYTGINPFNFNTPYQQNDTLAGLMGIDEFNTDRGYRTAAALFDLDHDNYPDLITGNFSGGLEYFGKGIDSPVNGVTNPNLYDDTRIRIYPLPARDFINVSCNECPQDQSAEIVLYDSKGMMALHFTCNLKENIRIDVRSLPKGLYMMKINMQFNQENFLQIHHKIILL